MEDDYEDILAELTENQRSLMKRWGQTAIRPNDALDEDISALLHLGLLEFQDPMYHKEGFSGRRISSPTGGGIVRPSDLGREWVEWYVRRSR